MKELIKLDNRWVTLDDWLKETAEHYRKEEEREGVNGEWHKEG